MTLPRLRSLQVGLPVKRGTPGATDPLQREWESAFVKTPVEGAVTAGPLGLVGDGQADRENHGGPDKALLAYAAAHYPSWNAELGRTDLTPGGFGENLTVGGLVEETVCVGDRYRVGGVLLEVSQPRAPCWKIARRWQVPDLTARVLATGRTGWYLRVLEGGALEAGMTLHLMARPYPEWTIARGNQLRRNVRGEPEAARRFADCPALSRVWREALHRELASTGNGAATL